MMNTTKLTSIVIGLALFALPIASQATTYTVTKTADTADGTCDSDCSLREAVIAANGGGADTINIPAGNYTFTRTAPGEDAASTGDLDLTDTDLTTIIGSGSGTGVGATKIDPDDHDRGFHIRPGAAADLSSLTVMDGDLDEQEQSGAGILNEGTLALDEVWVYGNTLETAALYDGYGAGVACLGDSLTIENSQIVDNIGSSLSGSVFGGGLAIVSSCDVTIANVTISGNTALNGGGAYIATDANTATLVDATITSNTAEDAGGGVMTYGGGGSNAVVINGALFESNTALSGGGVFASGPMDITNASFYGNDATDTGGALGSDGVDSPLIRLVFVTMTRNTAGVAAAGIYAGGISPNVYLKGSIVAANYIDEATDDCSGSIFSADYNYIADLGPLCEIAAQTHDVVNEPAGSIYYTAMPSDEGGNVEVLALWAEGETLNMIPESDCSDLNGNPIITDARGMSRPQGAGCELGAYELGYSAPVTGLTATPSGASVQLSWTNPVETGFDHVVIRRSTSGYPATITDGTAVTTTTGTSYTQSDLTDNTYYYSVFAVDTDENVSDATQVSAVVDTTPPSAPTGFIASRTGSNVTLSWTNPVSDFSSVTIRRSTSSYPTSTTDGTPVASGISTTSRSDNGLSDNTYYYSIFALDASGNASVRTTVSIVVDTVTQTPVLTSPTASSTVNTLTLNYALPEAPLAGTPKVTFTNGSITRILNMDTSTSVNVSVSLTSLTSTSNVTSVTGGAALPDGTYTVTLSYQDGLGNTAATSTAANVTVDTATQTPTLTSPIGSSNQNSLTLQYSLPESPLMDSVDVVFNNGVTSTTLEMDTTQSVNVSINLSNLSATGHVSNTAGTVLVDGTYSVTLQYQDALGNPVQSTSVTGVVLDRIVPTLSLVGNSTVTLTEGTTYTDQGAEAIDAQDGDISDDISIVNPVDVNTPGTYTVTYNVTDAAGNAAITITRTVIVEAAPITVPDRVSYRSISVAKQGKNRVVSWSAAERATKYTIRIKNQAKNTKLLKRNITAAQYRLTNKWLNNHLVLGKRYRIQVKACNTAGCSTWSKTKVWLFQ